MKINSVERVKKALEHNEPDRIPFDLGSTSATGIHVKEYENLTAYLGIKSSLKIIDMMQQLAYIDEDLLDKLGVDTRGLTPNLPYNQNTKIEEDEHYTYFIDRLGIKYRKPREKGYYYDMYKFPLRGRIEVDDIDRYKLPSINSYKGLIGGVKKLRSVNKQPAIVLEASEGGILEIAFWLRGFEDFYIDLASNIKIACYLMDKILDYKMKCWEGALKEVGQFITVAWEADDLGLQDRPMFSPEIYRKYVKPRHKKLFSFIKRIAPQKVYLAFHSCGSVYDFIPDLIEIGIDALNPVQVSAAKMDTKKLKKEFGKDITFWGGGIDTQYTLPRGSVKEIKEEVKRRIEDLAPGGGFIFTPVHNIQAGVPPENIIAMWEALQEYGIY